MLFRVGLMKEASPIDSVLTVRMDRPVKRRVVHTHKSAGTMSCVDLLQGRDSKEIVVDVGVFRWIV